MPEAPELLEQVIEQPITITGNKPQKVNLLGMDLPHLKAFFTEIGEKPFRAVQILKWIHQFGWIILMI